MNPKYLGMGVSGVIVKGREISVRPSLVNARSPEQGE